MSKFVVDTYQINVGAGDCSVHILAKINPGATNRGAIEKAVLVDGGDIENSREYIRQSLADIAVHYDGASNNLRAPIQFDGFVVSHWDSDHYMGMKDLLMKDLETQYEQAAASVTSTYETWTNDPNRKPTDEPPTSVDLTKLKSSYMKYGTNGELLSTLYGPIWTRSSRRPKYSGPPSSYWRRNGSDGALEINAGAFPPAVVQTGGKAKRKALDEKWVPKQCKVVTDAENLIGLNLFTGVLKTGSTKPGPWSSIKTVAQLLSLHNSTQPGMYCVAATRQVIGRPFTKLTAKDLAGPGAEPFDNTGPSYTNQMSLAWIIVWPAVAPAKPRVSLYTGGDAEGYIETRLLPFLKDIDSITVLKAGHHGSDATLQPSFIQQLKPSKIVFSAGKAHQHPNWTRLALLCAYIMNRLSDSTPDEAILWATCYPYYFNITDQLKVEKMKRYFNLSAFYGTSKNDKQFRTILTQWTDAWQNKTKYKFPSLLQTYLQHLEEIGDKNDPPKDDTLKIIIPALAEYLKIHWQVLSDITPTDLAHNALHSDGTPIHGTTRLSQLWIQHRDSGDDGTIAVHRGGIWQPAAKKSKSQSVRRSKADDVAAERKEMPGAKKLRSNPEYFQNEVTEAKDAPSDDGATSEEEESDDDEQDEDDAGPPQMLFSPAPPMALATTGVSKTLSLEFIIAQGWETVDRALPLPADDPIEWLVHALDLSMLTLDKPVAVAIANDQPVVVKDMVLRPDDMFNQWLTQTAAVYMVTLSGAVNGLGTNISINTWDMWMDPTRSTDDASRKMRLHFSSSATVLQTTLGFGGSNPRDGVHADTGFSGTLGGLVLGLVEEPTATLSLRQLCTFLEFTTPNYLVDSLLDTVQLQIKCDIDAQHSRDERRMAANAVYFRPKENYSIIVRLHMHEASGGHITAFLATKLPDIAITNLRIVAYKDCRRTVMQSQNVWAYNVDASLLFRADFRIGSGGQLGTASIVCNAEGLDLTAQWDPKTATDPLSGILEWISKRVSAGVGFSADSITSVLKDMGTTNPLRLRRFFARIATTARPTLQVIRLEFEVDLDIGAAPGTQVPLLITLQWIPGRWSLRGEMWPPQDLPDTCASPSIWPTYDPLKLLRHTCPKASNHFSLAYLGRKDPANGGASTTIDSAHIPRGVPQDIYDAVLEIASDSTTVAATLRCSPSAQTGAVPLIALDTLKLYAKYYRARNSIPAGFDLRLEGSVKLSPRSSAVEEYSPATFGLTLAHANSTWTLRATTADIKFASLYSLFTTGGEQDAVMNVMEHLEVRDFSVLYQYKQGAASSFDAEGTLIMGDVELDLYYTHRGDSWDFKAILGEDRKAALLAASPQESTIGSLLKGVSPQFEAYIPDVIANIPFNLHNAHVGMVCQSQKASTNAPEDKPAVVMALVLEFDSFQITVAQIQEHSNDKDKTKASQATRAIRPKRLVKLTLDSFKFPDLGMVGPLEQPFEALDFIWCSEDLTRAQITMVNSMVLEDRDLFPQKKEPIRYKGADSSGTNTPDIVVTAGSHLMMTVVRSGAPEVLVDYAFGAAKDKNNTVPPAPPSPPPAPGKAPALAGTGEEVSAPVSQQKSALEISALGLALKEKVLCITITARLAIGPLEFGLIDFAVKIDYTHVKHLRDLSELGISASIGGIEVEYNKPPVVIAGLFRHSIKDGLDLYAGGINLGIAPYNFLAAGSYGQAKGPPPDRKVFTTLFVFAKLNGPLVEFEFAEINGICGGFGYNSLLRFPEISQLGQFPLLTTADGGGKDPLDELNALTQSTWIVPQNDALWLAAGLEVKAFQVVDISAVVAVSLGDSTSIGLFAEAVAQLPKGVTDSNEVLLLVDFLFTAQINFTKGTLIVGGELAPRSFILHPSCHLQGGMALAYWFPNSEHAGDWVFTIGGYHPQFKKPAHYPDAKRLAISWTYDEHLSIGGSAYCALTPRVCMAGVRLQARFHTDSLKASLDAHADFMVNFSPLQFTGEVGISIHVEYHLDLGPLSDTYSDDLNAMIKIHGPPIGGTVHVKWHIFSFTVDFGPGYQPKPPLSLKQFWSTICQNQNEDVSHTFALEKGAIVTAAKDAWVVRGSGFTCSVAFRLAAVSIQYGTNGEIAGSKVHAKPCKAAGANLSSDAHIRIAPKGKIDDDKSLLPFSMSVEKKEMPKTLWGEYNFMHDPDFMGQGVAFSATDTEKDTITHIMGASFSLPAPRPSDDRIPPINLADAKKVDVLTDPNLLPQIPTAELDAALPPLFKTTTEARDAWAKPDRPISAPNILSIFSQVVESNASDSRAGMEFSQLVGEPPQQLFAEWTDIFANAPGTERAVTKGPSAKEAPAPKVPVFRCNGGVAVDPATWYTALPVA